ncbi:MAG TPA: glycosyltransferase family 39 protein [Polyangiaceae bacterium]|nr:glycosyltransferase family 39 protein [Polyangiaceae bacterium]
MGERADEAQPAPSRRWTAETWSTLAALSIVAVGTALRMTWAVRNSDNPLIDENEIVEQAAAFLGPDLHFYFLKYGPLTMYVVSGIYRIVAALRGMTNLDYASLVFFDGGEHYAIARIYTLAWLEVLALVAFFFLRRQVGRAPALLTCALLALPFVEVVASPGARIDVPQAAFQGLALLALTEAMASQRSRYWLMAGACAGLAIATKPLPGLLLGPTFLLASWFAAAQRPDGSPRPLLARLGVAVAGRGLWLSAVAVVLLAVLGNPTLIEIQKFIQSQREAVALHSGNALAARADISTIFLMLRVPFLTFAALAAVAGLAGRDRRVLLILLFVGVYVAAFVGRAARTYFMVAPVAALCLLVGYGFARAQAWLGTRPLARWFEWAWLPIAAASIYAPALLIDLWTERPSPALATYRWMEANAAPGSRVFHLGGRPYGTYLVTNSEKVQSGWGDHFEYGRYKYRFLKEAFHKAFSEYPASGRPRYAIEVRDEVPLPRSAKKNSRWITDGLVKHAREKKQQFIILVGFRGRVLDLGYTWFKQATLEQEFDRIAIFRVPDAPAVAAAPAAAVPGAAPAVAPAATAPPAAEPEETEPPEAEPATDPVDPASEAAAPPAPTPVR